jgi:hypothetical protein
VGTGIIVTGISCSPIHFHLLISKTGGTFGATIVGTGIIVTGTIGYP